MKKLLLASVFAAAPLLGMAPEAAAQPVANWTGFYVGANLGVGRQTGTADYTQVSAWEGYSGNSSVDPNNIIATFGLQAGYNYQVNRFVMGGEVDYLVVMGGRPSATGGYVDSGSTFTANMGTRQAFSFRARGGVDVGGVLLYGTMGLGLMQVRNSANSNAPDCWGPGGTICGAKGGGFTNNSWTTAFVIGGGAEAMITPRLAVRMQVLYYMAGSNSGVANSSYYNWYGANPSVRYTDQNLLVGQVGLSYRF